MNKYTVIGLYPDNEQVCCFHVLAETPEQAPKVAQNETDEYFKTVEIFEGHLMSVSPYSYLGEAEWHKNDKPLPPELIKYHTTFNYLDFALPHQAVTDCHHRGACDDDVEHWQKKLNLNLDRDKMILELKEYGSWELDELNALDNADLEQKLIWLAAGDIQESDEWTNKGE